MKINQKKFCDAMNISYPIIQAPMAGGATTPELVAAVANKGALGSLGAGYLAPAELALAIATIKNISSKPFAVNLLVPGLTPPAHAKLPQCVEILNSICADLNIKVTQPLPPYAHSFDEQMEIVLKEKTPIFSFTFGVPDLYWWEKLKSQGVKLLGTATNIKEAKKLRELECDYIVLQGKEAGGHRGTFIGEVKDALHPLKELVEECLSHNFPNLVAAGGLMNAQHIKPYLDLEVAAVQLGTAFLSSREAGIHPSYKEKLLHLKSGSTVLTKSFSGKYARGINNLFIHRMQLHQDLISDYPVQNALTQSVRKKAAQQNNPEFMSMWAGENAHFCKSSSVSDLLDELYTWQQS